MGFIEFFLIGIGLSMDAFAVSLCKGLKMSRFNITQSIIVALFFGLAQAIMPLFGWLLGTRFQSLIVSWDHWIAFVLLFFIGAKMIKESFEKPDSDTENTCDDCNANLSNNISQKNQTAQSLDLKELFILAIATSIDALAVGISFAFLNVNIFQSIIIIGCTTFVISIAGVAIGNLFGIKYKSKAELVGGIILIMIGIKILIEHLLNG